MFKLKVNTTLQHANTKTTCSNKLNITVREISSGSLLNSTKNLFPTKTLQHYPQTSYCNWKQQFNKEFKLATYNRSYTPIQINVSSAFTPKRVLAFRKTPAKVEEKEEEEDEETQKAIRDVLPPFSFGKSILSHALFALLVGGGVVAFANTDQAQDWNRQRLQKARKARMAAKPTDDALTIWWRKIGDSGKTIGAIIAINTGVFLMWQQPAVQYFMIRNFVHSAANYRVSPMLLSVFSHKTVLHLLFNMYGLYLFGLHVHEIVGREQFLAIYIAGGMSASLFSHLFKLGIRDPIPSLGASGAIFSIVAASAYFDPYTRMQFVFFPFLNFSKEQLVLGMALFDAVGLIGMAFKKHFFGLDHAAHLGGVIFGWVYCNWLYPKRPSLSSRRVN